MSVHSRLRTPNPHLGAYFGIVTSAFISLAVVLAMFEQLGWSDTAIAQAMLLAPLAVYLLIAFGARTSDLQDFYVSGRRVPPVFNGAVLAATAVGGVGTLAYTGVVFFLGFDALAIGLGWAFGMLIACVLFVPYLRKAGAFTLPSFLSHRFRSRTVRLVASLLQIPPAILLLAAEIKIAALVSAIFLPLSYSFSALLITALVAGTAILGGMRALTWTGSAQFIMGLVGLAIPLIAVSVVFTNLPAPQLTFGEELPALQNAEVTAGLTPLEPGAQDQVLPPQAPQPVTKPFLQPFGALGAADFIMLFLCLAIGTAALPSLLARSGVTSSVAEQRRSSAWALFFVGLFAVTAPSIAAFAKLIIFQDIAQASSALPPWLSDLSGRLWVQAGDANGDGLIAGSELLVARDGIALALPVAAQLPYILTALLGASAMGVALAAAGSHLFTIGASLAEDAYRALDRRPVALPRLMAAWAAIAATALFAVMILLIADVDPLNAALTGFALTGATFFPVLLLAIWWPLCTERGALAAIGTGFLIVAATAIITGGFSSGMGTAMASVAGSILAIAAGVGASLYAGPRASAAEIVYCVDMRDPDGEAIYDRAQQRAAAASAAAETAPAS